MSFLISFLLRDGAPESVTGGGRVPELTSAALFLLSIPVSFVTRWAYLLWIAIPFVLRVVRVISSRRPATAAVG